VPHEFIHTLRVRIRAWGFRYFRFYPLRCSKLPSMLFLGCGVASQTQGSVTAGILAGHPWRIKTLEFVCDKLHLSAEGG
jgi:hypothetical protein